MNTALLRMLAICYKILKDSIHVVALCLFGRKQILALAERKSINALEFIKINYIQGDFFLSQQ